MKKIIYSLLLILIFGFMISCDSSQTEEKTLRIIVNAGVDTIEVFENFTDNGAIATYGTDLVAVKTESNVDTTVIGEYTVTYSATYEGTTVKATRKVNVVDQTAPEIFLNAGVDTVRVGDDWIDASVTTRDNSLGNVNVSVEGSVDTTKVGEYVITYTATDESGNKSTIVRYVNVV